MNYFAKNFYFCRKILKISQQSLADQLDKSQTTVGGWENKVSEPNVDALIKISEVFGISIDDLIKVDLSTVNPIELPSIIKKMDNVNLNVNQTVNLLRKKSGIYTEFEPPLSVVNEDSQVEQWATLKLLRQIDQKVDQLLLSAGNKPTQGAE